MSSDTKRNLKPYKNCPECTHSKIAKNRYRNGAQRFKCKFCGYQFQSKRQPARKANKIAQDYPLKNRV